MGALSRVYSLNASTNQVGTPMGDIVRLVPKSELERIRLIRETRAIYDSIFPPTDVVGERPDGRVSQGTQPGGRGLLPRERNGRMTETTSSGNSPCRDSLPLGNIWQSCHGLDFGARARRRLIAVDDECRPTRLLHLED